MMTSSNGNIFCVCREFTSQQLIPHTKSSDVKLWCFLWSASWINGWVNNREAGDLRCQCTHFDVIVMISMHFLLSRQHISKWFTRYHKMTALKISCPIVDINNISKPEKLAAVNLKRKCSVHLYTRTTQLQWSFLPQDFFDTLQMAFFLIQGQWWFVCMNHEKTIYITYAGIILVMGSANERRHYVVMLLSLAEPLPRMIPA